MPTANYFIGPADGWVEIANAPDFVRVSGFPHSHSYYVYAGSSAPSLISTTKGTGTVSFNAVPADGKTLTISSETYTFVALHYGTGTVTINTQPAADDTVTIQDEVYTFKVSAVGPTEVTIGADVNATAANFATVVTGNSNYVDAVASTNVVTLLAYSDGTVGNYTLAKSSTHITLSGATMTGGVNSILTAFQVGTRPADIITTRSNFQNVVDADSLIITQSALDTDTVTITAVAGGFGGNYALRTNSTDIIFSGATLTGGEDAVAGILVCHHPFKVNVTMTEKLYARVQTPVPNAKHNDGKLRLDVFTI